MLTDLGPTLLDQSYEYLAAPWVHDYGRQFFSYESDLKLVD